MLPPPADASPPVARRSFLAGLLQVTTAGLIGSGLARVGGCTPSAEDAAVLSVDVSSMVVGERLVVEGVDFPVELRRTPDGIAARSLLCTHQGCVVRWIELDRQYLCPCHEARFDEHGTPKYGPAQRPLRHLPVRLEGEVAHVDLRAPEA